MPDFPRGPPHPHGFDANRPYDATYPYSAPHNASHPSGPVPGYSQQMIPPNYNRHTPSAYDPSTDPYLDYNAPPPPSSTLRVVRYSPTRGRPGAPFTAIVTSPWEIMANSSSTSFQFNRNKRVPATITADNGVHTDRQYHYLLSSQVPQLPDISEWVADVPIMLVIDSPQSEEYLTEVGNFTYEQEPVRTEAEDSRQGLRGSNLEMRNDADYQPYQSYNNIPYRQQYSMASQYDSLPAPSYRDNSMNQQISTPLTQLHTPTQTLMPSWASQSRNNSISRQPPPTISPSNPKLVRTSTIEQFRTPLGQSAAGTGAYYHQAMKPPSVHLRFDPDLERLGRPELWSQEQLGNGRRVVYFQRRQQGAEIFLRFHVASADQVGGGGSIRPPNSFPLSCILWRKKQQCFVTSVDTISLLEFIMAQKFPTEEKNRIRRNLEHFRPITVKKPVPNGSQANGGGEGDTNEIFATIMAFGAPKPRNIEKDIKVFRWKDLKNALLKITGKYSIKPGNSLPPPQPQAQQALPTPASSTGGSSGYSMDHPGMYVQNTDRTATGMFSPRNSITRSISGQSHGYAPSSFQGAASTNQRLNSPQSYNLNPIRELANMNQTSMHNQMAIRELADVNQTSMHNQMPAYGAQHWPTTPTHHMPAPHAPSQYGTPRASWDMVMGSAMGSGLTAFPENSGGGAAAAGLGGQELQHQQTSSPRGTGPQGEHTHRGDGRQGDGQQFETSGGRFAEDRKEGGWETRR